MPDKKLGEDELCHNGRPDCLAMQVMGRLGDDYCQGMQKPLVMERMKYDEWRRK